MIFKDNPTFSLTVNGQEYKDCWEYIHLSNSMESICGEMSVSTIDFFEQQSKWNLKMDSEYTAKINKETIGTGYIDSIDEEYSDIGHSITFSGRDKTCDLVDCQHKSDKSGEYKNQTIKQLIETLCNPFGIKVVVSTLVTSNANTKKATYTIDEGRNIGEQIVELCAGVGILPVSLGDGKLTLTQATTLDTCSDILSDTNVKSASLAYSHIERFKNYYVKTEGKPEKIYDNNKEWIYHIENDKPILGEYEDSKITRHKPYIIIDDVSVNKKQCEDRAKYEANIRAAQSITLTYVLEGWTEVNSGLIWKPNKLVMVNDKKFEINEQMLINSVSLDYDGKWETTLELVKKDCYSLSSTATSLAKLGFSL